MIKITECNITRKQHANRQSTLGRRERDIKMVNTKTVLIAFLSALGVATAANVATSCVDGQPPAFDAVQVFIGNQECTSSPCNLVRGQVARCSITFTAANEITLITQKINATVLGTGITTPFPVPDAEKGCDKLSNAYCPVDRGETGVLDMQFEVLPIYPKVGLELVLYLLDQSNQQISCFKMRGNVVD